MIIAAPKAQPAAECFDSRKAAPEILTSFVLETEAEFVGLAAAWRELSKCSVCRTPLSDWDWLLTWWRVLGARCPKTGRHGVPFVVVVKRGEETAGIFPFVSHPTPWWNLRRLRPMGYSGKLEPSGLTEEPVGLWRPEVEQEVKAEVELQLREAVSAGRFDCAIFRHLALNASTKSEHVRLAFLSRKVKRGPGIVNLPSDWPTFRKQLSKSMRDNLPYYPRLLKRAGHSFSVRYYSEPFEIDAAAARLVELHKRRVSADTSHGHRDYFVHPWEQQMLREGLSAMAADGKGFIAVLEVDGNEVAAQAFLRNEDRLVVHYSGFDPDYAKFSPLLVIQADVFQRAIEQGVRELDLLYGTAQWQTRWGAEPKEQDARTLILSTRPLALARAAGYALRREVCSALRRRGIEVRFPRIAGRLGAFAGAGMEFHSFAIRAASSPVMHHLIRVHR